MENCLFFKYCADMENCDASRGFGFIYIYIYIYIIYIYIYDKGERVID